MKILLLSLVLVVIAGVGGWLYWRKRNKPESPIVSLVLLLREPLTLDTAVLAKTAGRAWDADLGEGSGEGEDGFVVSVGPISTIMHKDRAYLVNCFPTPYTDDPETAAEAIRDMRIKGLYREHRAWFSCDALAVDESTTPEEITRYYGRLAKLIANFVDDNCLLVYVPQARHAYPLTDEIRLALESDDPLTALRAAEPAHVVSVPPDDEEMAAAEQEARTNWPRFVAAFEQRSGEEFSVKAPITHKDATEFIWIHVTALEGDRIYGELGNQPANLGTLALGSKVSVSVAELNDWCYIDAEGQLQGGFTVSVVLKAASRN